MKTFNDILNFIQRAPVNNVGFHHVGGNWDLQIYANKHQVNVCRDGLSLVNIVFQADEETVKVYPCPRPGYCDYFHPKEFALSCPINMIPVTGDIIETIRDAIK